MSHMADCKSLAERWCKHSGVEMRFKPHWNPKSRLELGLDNPLAMSLHDLTRENVDIGLTPVFGTCKLMSHEYSKRSHWHFYGKTEEHCCKSFLECLLRDDEEFSFKISQVNGYKFSRGIVRNLLKPKSLEELEIELSLRAF